MLTPDLLVTGAAVAVNLGALVVSVIRIVSLTRKSVHESEERITREIQQLDVRAAKLEIKVDRAEKDIQGIFHIMPKRVNDRT